MFFQPIYPPATSDFSCSVPLYVFLVTLILEERGGFAVSVEVLVTCIAPFKP